MVEASTLDNEIVWHEIPIWQKLDNIVQKPYWDLNLDQILLFCYSIGQMQSGTKDIFDISSTGKGWRCDGSIVTENRQGEFTAII